MAVISWVWAEPEQPRLSGLGRQESSLGRPPAGGRRAWDSTERPCPTGSTHLARSQGLPVWPHPEVPCRGAGLVLGRPGRRAPRLTLSGGQHTECAEDQPLPPTCQARAPIPPTLALQPPVPTNRGVDD